MKYLNLYEDIDWDKDFDFEEELPIEYKYIVDLNRRDKNFVYILVDNDKIFKNHQIPKQNINNLNIRKITPDEIVRLKNNEILIKIKDGVKRRNDDGWNYYDYSELIKKYPELKI